MAQSRVYEAAYLTYVGAGILEEYGRFTISLPAIDADGNGLPDVTQANQPGNAALTGTGRSDWPTATSFTLSGQLTRAANSTAGNYTVLLNNPAGPVNYTGTFYLRYLSGSVTYSRRPGNSLAFHLTRTDQYGVTTTLTGTNSFTVVSPDRISLPQFSLSSSDGNTYTILSSSLNRSGHKYIGNLQLADGDLNTPWPDYTDWVVEITDPNDANGNGVPDLSDVLAPSAPAITVQPQSQTVTAGQAVTFSVVASGTPPPTYQWRLNGVNILGATNSILLLTNVQPSNAGDYAVVVTNPVGTATSGAANLTVVEPPTITGQPQDQNVIKGVSASFAVQANGAPPLGFQWRFDGVPVPGATNASYTIPSVSADSSGAYTVTITNQGGTTLSRIARLLVNPLATKLWEFKTADAVLSSPAIAPDGTVYVGSHDHHLYAITSDGTLKWSFTTGFVVQSAPALDADGTVHFASVDHKVYAVRADGTLKWMFTTGAYVYSSPAIGLDGTVYVGSDDHKLYALNPNGIEKWAFVTGYNISSSPAVGPDGTIYVGSGDHNVYAINPDGTQKWAFTTGDQVASSPAVGADGTIYVGSDDHHLYALHSEGTMKWAFTAGAYVDSSPALASDGSVYCGARDNTVYALKADGTPKWARATGDIVVSSPAISADGTVYVGSHDHNFYALNPDGSTQWVFRTMSAVYSSPAISSNGTLYIGSQDGTLYAIQTETALAWTSWPGFRHDAEHTGRTGVSGRLRDPTLPPNTGFHADLTGHTGWSYVIETSTNLVRWSPLTNLVATTNATSFTDFRITNSRLRFYRARASP